MATDLVDYLDKLQLVDERVAAHHVHVALVELAVTPLLRAVGTPHGLYLVTAEGEGDFVPVLHHEAGEWHGEVVAQPLLADAAGEARAVAGQQLVVGEARQVVARVEHLEQQLVALVAVFAHEGGERLHGGRLYLLVAVEAEHTLDGVEDVVALRHFVGREVARPFRDGWFLHN